MMILTRVVTDVAVDVIVVMVVVIVVVFGGTGPEAAPLDESGAFFGGVFEIGAVFGTAFHD